MKVTEIIKISDFRTKTIGYKCDVCGKMHEGESFPNNWHSFDQHNEEYGIYSSETYENHQVCSTDCYWDRFEECVKGYVDTQDAEIDGFNIQFARLLVQK